MHYFFKNLLLYTQAFIRQTKHIVMMNKKGSTKIVNLLTPGVGFSCAWLYKSYSKNALFLCLLLYSQAWIRQTKYKLLMTNERSTQIVNFMQIWSLLTRSQCRVSDTQVTFKAHGSLVLLGSWLEVWPMWHMDLLYEYIIKVKSRFLSIYLQINVKLFSI